MSSDKTIKNGDSTSAPKLARQLGLFDATMIVMGGIIGSGIFINPSVVARAVHTPGLLLGAWAAGGVIALLGAFLYGWALLLVVQSGGMAAVAVTCARYTTELTGVPIGDAALATVVLLVLT